MFKEDFMDNKPASGDNCKNECEKTATEAVSALIDIIMSSRCYLNYRDAARAVAGNDALTAKIRDFKELNYNLNIKSAGGGELSPEEERRLAEMYWKLALDRGADEYLESEKNLAVMLNEIFKKIVAKLDLDIDFYI